MFEEIIHSVFISDLNSSHNKDIYNKYNISVVINCTDNGKFINKDILKYRVPLTSSINSNHDIIQLKKYKNNIFNIIKKYLFKKNILICCYDGKLISPLIIALFIMKYGNVKSYDILKSKNNKIILDYDLDYILN